MPSCGRTPASGGVTNLLSRRKTAAKKTSGSASYSLLLKDSTIYGGGRMLQKFLTALMLPLFTAFMSKSDYGIIGMVVTVTTFIDVFVTLGFDVAYTRFYFDDKDLAGRNKVLTHVFYVDFVYPAALLGTIALFVPQISQLLMGSTSYAIYFYIGIATEFVINLNDLPFQTLRLDHRPWTFTGFTVARVLIQVPLAIVFLAVFHWGPAGYLGANLVTAIILGLAALPVWVPRLRLAWDGALMVAMLAFAVPAMLHAVSFFFLKLSDRFFLQHYEGTSAVGLYTVANSLAQPLYIVGMAFRMAWPQWHYSKLHDTAVHKQMVSRSSTYFMAFNAVLLAMIGIYLPLVMHVLLNRNFWSIGPTTFVLTLSTVLYNIYYIFWIGSNVAKKNSMIPVITLIASGVNIGLNFILIPRYGMYAAAWTTTLGFFILAVLVYFWSDHWYPIPFEWRRLSILGAGAALTLGAGWAIGSVLGLSVYQPLGKLILSELAVTPTLLIFPLLFWATKFFTPREADRLRDIGRRLTGRGARTPGIAPVPAMAGAAVSGSGPLGRGREYADHLSRDDLEAEEEEAEIEAEIDITEGGSSLP
ncbi:MAG TPA: oligosaccharide flippase family protein [Thermoleophilia bacterium]|nr:oligosaccharide flippase family protein [Thermoleophilia bacterium]